MDLGYARASNYAKQDLDRQISALIAAGLPLERIYVDRRSGAPVDRPGLRDLISYAREGDVVVVTTLDRLARTIGDGRDPLHELAERNVEVRSLAKLNSRGPDGPIA